jgi:hypothetical protein
VKQVEEESLPLPLPLPLPFNVDFGGDLNKISFILVSAMIALAARADTLDFNSWTIRLSAQAKSAALSDQVPDLTSRALKLLSGAYFDDNQTVADYLAATPKAGRKLSHLNLPMSQTGTNYLSDGTVTAEYDIPLTGAILEILTPKTGGGVPVGPLACPICGQPWPEGKEVPPGITLVPLEEGNPVIYTGVLIDARNIDLNPALFPRILNEDGRVVYGPEFLISTFAAQRGSVGYYDQMMPAQNDDRVGLNPIRINALRASGRDSTDLIISDADALRLHGSLENLKLLERCRVVILTD